MQPADDEPWPPPWPEGVPLEPCPPLALTEPLRQRLREIREQQMATHVAGCPALACALFHEEEVVCLRVSGDRAVFLGTDGRLHYENFGEGKDRVVLTNPRDVAASIVRCAGGLGLPELA